MPPAKRSLKTKTKVCLHKNKLLNQIEMLNLEYLPFEHFYYSNLKCVVQTGDVLLLGLRNAYHLHHITRTVEYKHRQ